MSEWLNRGKQLAQKYGGKIVAIGCIGENPLYIGSREDVHFTSKNFAEIKSCWVLKNPISIDDFKGVISVSRFSSITRVYGEAYDLLKASILSMNPNPPDYFLNAISSR